MNNKIKKINIMFFLGLILVVIYFRKESFISFIKKKKKKRVNPYSGLQASNTNMLERMCLDSLKKNFKCQCNKKRLHFPEILSLDENDEQYFIEMTHKGKSILSIRKKDVNKLKEVNKLNGNKLEFNNQINCMLSNLRRSNVFHADMHSSGKNMTITDDGDLALIDFDIAYINNFKPKHSKINRINKYMNKTNNYKQFYNILNKKGLMIPEFL